ncbi:MAG: phytoene desaturase [Bacteroidota bacterium]|jgi:phytoene desaturase
MKEEVIVIGSGVGGLATAIRLAKLGCKVTVYEKNEFIGGKVHTRNFNGYRYDMGPSVFTEPHLIEELIALGLDQKPFEYNALPESFRYFFPDGSSYTLPTGTEETIKVLVEEFGENPQRVRAYLKRLKRNYEVLKPVFIETTLHRFSHLFNGRLIPAILRIPRYGLLTTMNGFSKRFFKHPKSVQLMNRYATYNGSDPYKTPGLLSIIAHLELNEGIYFPKGGMVSITQSLADAARSLGVVFHANSSVDSIEVMKNRVVGVRVNNTVVPASIVVSNADAHYTYEHLMPAVKRPTKILQQEMSSSAVVFYWGINREFSNLGVHNMFFAKDYRAEFKAIFETKTLVEDPSIYVHISSKAEPTDAPPGCENWFVMVNAPINIGQDWTALVAQLRRNVLNKLSASLGRDIEGLIETEYINDPLRLQHTYNGKSGSIYGNSSNTALAAFYRHPNHAPEVKGVYFAGVTVHPGGGIPLAVSGAKIIERMVKEDFPQEAL